MEGKTHLLTAVACYSLINTVTANTGFANITHIINTPDTAFISLTAILTGVIIPDMDQPGSTAGKKVTLVNMKMVKLIINIFLLIFGGLIFIYSGNKYILYCGGGILALLLLSYKTLTNKILHILRRAVQIIIITSLITGFTISHNIQLLFFAVILLCYFFSGHRGLSHTLILSMLSSVCIYKAFAGYGYTMYGYYAAAYFFMGCFLHIFIGDYFTDKGVPNPLYPIINILKLPFCIVKYGLCKKAFKESFKITRIKFWFTISTGSAGEVIFSIVCVVITLFSFVTAIKNIL